MTSVSEQVYASALTQVAGVGARLLFDLKTHFASYSSAWNADPVEWLDLPGVTGGLKDRFSEHRSRFDVEEFSQELKNKGIEVLVIDSPEFPELLMETSSPPPVLYVKGDISCLVPDKVAIVGTRKASEYGRESARRLARDLVDLGLVVVSGMALGIDGSAHEGALEGGGQTIAVLGNGVDVIYPEEHEALYMQICEKGLLVSEKPPGSPPLRENFPSRNRIISGLSRAVVVVEAPINSGALITADCASDQNRLVFAVPGSIKSYSFKGCHKLIKQGAKLVEDVDDIVTEFGVSKFELLRDQREKLQERLFREETRAIPLVNEGAPGAIPSEKTEKVKSHSVKPKVQKDIEVRDVAHPPQPKLADEEITLLDEISYEEAIHINNLARKLKLSIAELSARLTLLEIKGLVKSLPGGFYQRL